MKIFTAKQIQALDRYTIAHEPIASIDLMERAAEAMVEFITTTWKSCTPIVCVAGSGNNGGDALAMARLLAKRGYEVKCYLFNLKERLSEDCAQNRRGLTEYGQIDFQEFTTTDALPALEPNELVIEGLLGTGFRAPIEERYIPLIKWINASASTIVSIDIPSGLMSEGVINEGRDCVVKAHYTLTLQTPKFSFFLAENQSYLGQVITLSIGLHPEAMATTEAHIKLLTQEEVAKHWTHRDPFAHKGTMGNGLLIGSKAGMAGASFLAGKAAFRCGIGKVTFHAAQENRIVLQSLLPEAILHEEESIHHFDRPIDTRSYQAVAIGPGLGLHPQTVKATLEQLASTVSPLVIDADALTILGQNRHSLERLPAGSILTPHPKELERMVGQCTSSYERWQRASELARTKGVYVVIKGHYSLICTPSGMTYINPTGNAGMATAGSGDVLTGIILGLLAQGYSPEACCLVGVYLHGLSGDIGAKKMEQECLMASDLIDYLPDAIKSLKDTKNKNYTHSHPLSCV